MMQQLHLALFAQLLTVLLMAASIVCKRPPLFEKDHLMDTVFPPVTWQHPDLPTGHLRALGHQRPPDGPLQVVSRKIAAVEFFAEYVRNQQPVVVRDAVGQDAPAMAEWTDERMRRLFGSQRVSVTHKKELMRGSVEVMDLSEFLDRYRMEDLYMASVVPQEMDSGFQLPRFASCGPLRRSATEAEMWMGAGGTGSLLHFHSQHQLHCVMDGRKDFIVIRPEFRDNLRCVETPTGSGNGKSELDVDMINCFESPKVTETPWRYATLLPGDCVFLPAGFLHQVRGYGRSFSFSVAFRLRDGDKDLGDCKKSHAASLAELPLKWTIVGGFTRLRDRQLTAESLRQLLLDELPASGFLTFSTFSNFYERATDGVDGGDRSGDKLSAKSAFRLLMRSDKKQVLTADSIRKLPVQQLDQVARFLNSVHKFVRDEL